MKIQSRLATLGAALVAISVICSDIAVAECNARDFNFDQMMTVAQELNDSTANLKALQAAGAGNGLLPVAIQIVDRSAVELTMFAGYITIYAGLTNEVDRKITDNFIFKTAGSTWNMAKGNADYLTLVATGLPQFGNEIRQSRDRLRKFQTLFSCAADK
jgi:hypothetical protein